jgi:uncharacterized protein (TIGR02246 family)
MLTLALSVALAAAPADSKAVAQEVFDRFGPAFEKRDAKALAALFTEDGRMMNPMGQAAKGRPEIERLVVADLEHLPQGAVRRFTVNDAREVGTDLLWVDATQKLTGVKGVDGRILHVVALLAQKDGQWSVVELRSYNLTMAPISPTLPGKK